MTPPRIYLTARGHALFLERIEGVLKLIREAQAEKGASCQEGSDNWHDNFAFEDLERKEIMLSRRYRDLVRALDEAVFVDSPRDHKRVQVGHHVRLRWPSGDETVVRIAGHGESDPARSVIAYDTPIGRALIGARPGDEREFHHGGRSRSVEVVAILPVTEGVEP